MSYHTIIIVGRLGRDPEQRYTPGGKAVTTFSVATDRRTVDANGQATKETIWFRVTVWDKQAEVCNTSLSKGKLVLVEGRLAADPTTGGPRVWKMQDGTPAASYEVVASVVRFLSPKEQAETELENF